MSKRSLELPVLRQSSPVNHAAAAAVFNADVERTDWHDESLWFVRQKRDRAASAVPDWEELRVRASAIKEHALTHLDEYLTQFEANALENGMQVHWARDADEHNRIVHGILERAGARRLVKSKSMLTEECGLNPYLESKGIDVVDSDLGERIVQFRKEGPSHIVLPAIHLKRGEVGETFHEHLGTPEGMDDPVALTRAAREHLRGKFLAADATLTGMNFAIAETGGFVVCTNEGNADLGMSLAPIHIASVGIEKVIPKVEHLPVFLRLLARSATGQAITAYSTHVHAPREGQVLHVILVDNGRTRQLAREEFWSSLKCIRCGACMNTCPVYRRSGGHSYGSTVPGPIGSVLTPGFDLEKYASLPFASTLCGSCTAVCPVKIDLDGQLFRWRQRVTEAGYSSTTKGAAIKTSVLLFDRPKLFRAAGALARLGLRLMPGPIARMASGVWGRTREAPVPPRESFRTWYRRERPGAKP